MAKRNILVIYYTRGVYPLRNSIETHLYSWKRYSKHNVFYINVAMGLPIGFLRSMRIDTIIFHTSFCGIRWSSDVFKRFLALTESIGEIDCLKIAMPQDEFIHSEMLVHMINRLNVNLVLSCADEDDWDQIYAGVDRGKVEFRTVLTGYLDDRVVSKVKKFHRPLEERDCEIAYRAWNAAFWLGEHATHKVRIAREVERAASERGLATDISLNDEHTIAGMDWFRFLAGSRATIGVEGGASILDKDGELKRRVETYFEQHPDASFEEVRQACFPGQDHTLGLSCLSPRHLEAAATKTCQILIEGEYNDILKPDVHYIPLRKDYSNMSEALDKLSDTALVRRIVETAYSDVVASRRFTYRAFVQDVEANFLSGPVNGRQSIADWWKTCVLRFRDWLNWRVIAAEVSYLKNPKRFRLVRRFASPIYRAIIDPPPT